MQLSREIYWTRTLTATIKTMKASLYDLPAHANNLAGGANHYQHVCTAALLGDDTTPTYKGLIAWINPARFPNKTAQCIPDVSFWDPQFPFF